MILVAGPFEEYELVETTLLESKSLHSLKITDEIRQAVIDSGYDMDKGKFRLARRNLSTKMKRKFDDLVSALQRALVSTSMDYLSQRKNPRVKNKMSKTAWQTKVKNSLRTAYETAFELGIQSSGASKYQVSTSSADLDFIRSAVREEMKYFNKLLDQIDQGKVRGGMMNRLSAYADALKHVFYSGRIMGTPSGMVIDWIAPMDRNTCGGCSFLYHHSPYTKATLPTTPRAGNTPCLNRCRCRLVVRSVSKEAYERVSKKHLSKRWYAQRLSAIKSGKALS
jgi:hypothetical protein